MLIGHAARRVFTSAISTRPGRGTQGKRVQAQYFPSVLCSGFRWIILSRMRHSSDSSPAVKKVNVNAARSEHTGLPPFSYIAHWRGVWPRKMAAPPVVLAVVTATAEMEPARPVGNVACRKKGVAQCAQSEPH